MPGKQHGQIRGYQVHYVRVENGESRGLPLIKDVMLADAQVWSCHCFLSTNKLCHKNVNSTAEHAHTVHQCSLCSEEIANVPMSAIESVFQSDYI